MSDHAWMEMCEVSSTPLHDLEANVVDAVLLRCPSSHHPELTSLILQPMPSSRPSESGHTVYLNPLLYEFVSSAAEIGGSKEPVESAASEVCVSIAPLPVKEYCHGTWGTSKPHKWTLSRINDIVGLPAGCTISITCIYREDSGASKALERQLCFALEGRLIRINSLLALPTISGTFLVTVTNITSGERVKLEEVVYRVGNIKNFTLDVTHHVDSLAVSENPIQSEWERDCPGHKEILQDLIILSQLQGVAAPAGVLLTGCAGIGKSRLASCLAYHASKSHNMHVQWISAQDLLARASWASESDLLETLLPRTTDKRCLLVIDDLQILINEDNETDTFHDPELLLVHNSILEALARLSRTDASPFILGIAHDATLLPKELVRIGRLEKIVQMNPPTQFQREEILAYLLQDVENREKRRKWAEMLGSQTAGCVASDLCRLCADAWTKARSRLSDNAKITWNDLRDAAYTCVPSQLAQLDVTKTAAYPNKDDGPPDPLLVHEWSWRNFGGYREIKKRLYRTVVMPWRRFMVENSGKDENKIRDSWVTPPSGVLFHGPPGVGKTLAASCLASSLELNVIKVRASDVLDQWLGGSEAAIRSLFARARAASPCILFFDEIDAIACNREDDGSSVDVSSRILTTFLNEMDGVSSGGDANSGVLVVACTNRLETLDAALLRPGRLDEHVMLPVPTTSDVSDILKLHLAKVPMNDDVNMTELADLLVEFNASGADVEGMCRDACSRVIREAAQLTSDLAVSQSDFLAALREWHK